MLIASLLTVLDSLQSNQRDSGNQGKYCLVCSNVSAYTVKYSTSIPSGPGVVPFFKSDRAICISFYVILPIRMGSEVTLGSTVEVMASILALLSRSKLWQ